MQKRFLFGLIGLIFAAATAQAGWEYTAVTKAEGGRQSAMMGQTMKASVAGGNAHIEIVSSGNPMMSAGSYLLIQEATKTMYLVRPQDKTYSSMSAMMGMAGGAMGMMNMQVKDPVVEKLLEEDGGKILGYPTTHYRFRTSYSMEMNLMGMNQVTSVRREEDVWSTTALKEIAFSFQGMQNSMKTGNAQLDKLIEAQRGKATGFPLKVIAAHTTTNPLGQTHVTKTTMEVTELKSASFAADLFKLPADYAERDLMAGLMGGGAAGKPSGAGQQSGDNPFLKMLQQQLQKQQ